MKFNRDIFLTAPLLANWATLDWWGNIHLHSSKPEKSECGLFFIGKQDAVRIKIGSQPYHMVHDPQLLQRP